MGKVLFWIYVRLRDFNFLQFTMIVAFLCLIKKSKIPTPEEADVPASQQYFLDTFSSTP